MPNEKEKQKTAHIVIQDKQKRPEDSNAPVMATRLS